MVAVKTLPVLLLSIPCGFLHASAQHWCVCMTSIPLAVRCRHPVVLTLHILLGSRMRWYHLYFDPLRGEVLLSAGSSVVSSDLFTASFPAGEMSGRTWDSIFVVSYPTVLPLLRTSGQNSAIRYKGPRRISIPSVSWGV